MLESTDFTITKKQVEHLRDAIEELLFLRSLLRKYTPDYQIEDNTDKKEMMRLIKKSAKYLIPLFEELGLCTENKPDISKILSPEMHPKIDVNIPIQPEQVVKNKEFPQVESGIEILNLIGENYIFISTNTAKKKLKNLGIDANKTIVAGGPINPEDLKELNPKMPESAIQGYMKKIETVLEQLDKAFITGKKVIYAMSPKDPTDQMNAKRLFSIEQKLGKKFEIIIVKDWDKV
jgi:hypothetical protein